MMFFRAAEDFRLILRRIKRTTETQTDKRTHTQVYTTIMKNKREREKKQKEKIERLRSIFIH